MPEFSRRTFLKFVGGSTAVLGMGLSGQSWAHIGSTKARMKKMETDVAVIGAPGRELSA